MAARNVWWMLVALVTLGGCAFDRNEHPAQMCNLSSDCDDGDECFAGFCVAREGGGTGGTGGNGGTGGGSVECTGSVTEPCYDGTLGTQDRGACRGGERLCVNGQWSQCLGQVVDGPEQCNQRDDDCDQEIDEIDDSDCNTTMLGECAVGRVGCVGALGICQQVNARVEELCDDKDNDCDGATDEDTSGVCFPATEGCQLASGAYQCDGVCRAGIRACGANVGDCDGAVVPGTELCTDVSSSDPSTDDDCDGAIDEQCACTGDATRACYGGPLGSEGLGACVLGSQQCNGSTWGDCIGDRGPSPETCVNSGVDDDCNGVVDDVPGVGEFCVDESMQGDCRTGTHQCQGATLRCVTPDATTEVCEDGQRDEDCDGLVNEGFDLTGDESNCGSCGNVCGDSQTCCAGQCVNLTSDPNACGTCETSCGGGACCSGDCADTTTDTNNCGGCGVACGASQNCCDSCTNTDVDTNNCGGCGTQCDPGQFCCDGGCQDGSCSCSACESAGGTCCDQSCTDTGTDEANCGGCGVTCNDGQSCLDGVCCGAGQILCNDACITVATDESHCGGCGNSCGSSQACCAGSCVELDSNANNCGACGQPCQSPSSCSGGLCCAAGTAACVDTCVDTQNSVSNCGGCGIRCDQGETCCSGECRDLYTDNRTCGSCGNSCGLVEACCQGECLRTGSSGSSNSCACEQDCGNLSCCGKSCVDTLTDANNCGGCGISCGSGGPSGRFCCNGQCSNGGICVLPL